MLGAPRHNTSLPNAPATIAIAAPGSGLPIQLLFLVFSYSAAPAGGLLTITDGAGITFLEQAVTSAGVGPLLPGIELPAKSALVITLSAGGAGVVGRVSVGVVV
jgi:hypothetical protein